MSSALIENIKGEPWSVDRILWTHGYSTGEVCRVKRVDCGDNCVSQRRIWEWWRYSQKTITAVGGDAGLTDRQMKVVRLRDKLISVSGITDESAVMKIYLK